ncbi:hypothetical protein [Lutibacter citreus]|uniref:hypothetical protein n=1 Tax=Lutibacter citreus TaxID=2138210 RepID=UPI001C556307|nr:hypothetical protein [Lutibacter citreus]
MKTYILIIISLVCLNTIYSQSNEINLLQSIHSNSNLENVNGLNVEVSKKNSVAVLKEKDLEKRKYSWFAIPVSSLVKQLETSKNIEATIKNTSKHSLSIMLWVVADKGWNAVGNTVEIKPNETKIVSCAIRATFPDGTPRLNPSNIQQVQLMLMKAKEGSTFKLQKLIANGTVSKFKRNKQRLVVPNMELCNPKPGKRVAYKLDKNSNLYAVLYLPKNFKHNKKYPVIVEFPGNIYYTNTVYSTGRPEQCVIGYGMAKGENAIWVSMPFVDYKKDEIAVSGWGNPDDTADYTVKIVNEIAEKFGGDKNNLILTGFSRGAIACGYIGLRNDTIAGLWKGIHACQHYDGDGWGGSEMDDAIERLKRFKGESFFETDNAKGDEPKNMLSNATVKTTFVNSGLSAHACDMFLDNRPSTLDLRKWFKNLVSK